MFLKCLDIPLSPVYGYPIVWPQFSLVENLEYQEKNYICLLPYRSSFLLGARTVFKSVGSVSRSCLRSGNWTRDCDFLFGKVSCSLLIIHPLDFFGAYRTTLPLQMLFHMNHLPNSLQVKPPWLLFLVCYSDHYNYSHFVFIVKYHHLTSTVSGPNIFIDYSKINDHQLWHPEDSIS